MSETIPIPTEAEEKAAWERLQQAHDDMEKARATVHEAVQAYFPASEEWQRVATLRKPLDETLLHFLIDISRRGGHTPASMAKYSYRACGEVTAEMDRIIAAGPVDWHGARYTVQFDGRQYTAELVTT
jgi:imidazoleglycerol phosphate dehydratase HisB